MPMVRHRGFYTNHMTKVEKWLTDIIEKYSMAILLVVVTVLALYARVLVLPFETEDFYGFYRLWYERIVEYGRLDSLGMLIGEYNPGYTLYVTLMSYLPFGVIGAVKFVPIFCDFATALLGMRMVYDMQKGRGVEKNQAWKWAAAAYIALVFAPTILINSALWGQCDSVLTFFLLLCYYLLIRRKYGFAFIALGVCLSIKTTAIIFLPVIFLAYLVRRDFSLIQCLWTPAVYMLIGMPAILKGAWWKNVIKMVISFDSSSTGLLHANINNLYSFVATKQYLLAHYIKELAMPFAIVVIGCLLLYFWKRKCNLEQSNFLLMALLLACAVVYVMPGMHDRYLYVGDVLSILVFCSMGDRKKWFIPVAVQLFSLISYFNYLNLYVIDMTVIGQIIAIGFLGFIIWLFFYTGKMTAPKEESMEV